MEGSLFFNMPGSENSAKLSLALQMGPFHYLAVKKE